jgi:DNA mismatch repair protein MutL
VSSPTGPVERTGRVDRPIRVLPEDLANQIAAGEVVERPSSVVKELCENAVDAGATRIAVEVLGGGIELVRVIDDGVGMGEGDAQLAVLRHATSKIAHKDDLGRIGTLGFRGEALPSIASVSRLTLRTRRSGDKVGSMVRIDGGAAPVREPVGGPVGTSVEVRDLFYNVPARRKFLRAAATESAHVTEVVQSLALAEPELAVMLVRDGRTTKDWARAKSREDRVRDVLGGETLAACRGVRGPLSVEAFLAPPERARTGTASLWMFVNGRPVRDRSVARAVAHAYGSVMPPGRYPIGVVYLDLPLELVDVNVHPQKSEVRFEDGRAVFDAIVRILGTTLASALGPRTAAGAPSSGTIHEAPAASWLGKRDGVASTWSGSGAMPAPEPLFARERPGDAASANDAAGAGESWRGDAGAPLRDATSIAAPFAGATTSSLFEGATFLAQVKRLFLVCETREGIVFLDQHAAAERVTFHRLREAYLAAHVASQRLLVPEVVRVTPAEVALVETAADAIAASGMEIRPAGADAVAVHAVPQLLLRARPEALVRDLLTELSRAGGRGFAGAVDLALATMACHGSIRAGDEISPQEARALLLALTEVDFAGHCPHGRPIVHRLSFQELLAKVGR